MSRRYGCRCSTDTARRCTCRRAAHSAPPRRVNYCAKRPASASWTSAWRADTPRRLPRQRNATQFMSGESGNISPLIEDLTYGLSRIMYEKGPPRTAYRSPRLGRQARFKLDRKRVEEGKSGDVGGRRIIKKKKSE